MIIIYHNHFEITDSVFDTQKPEIEVIGRKIVAGILEISKKYSDEIIVWCHENKRANLNIDAIESIFHHKKIMISYNASPIVYFNTKVGYIENTNFINVVKKVTYPTWQMSSQVGAIHTTVLQACIEDLMEEKNFDYFLNSFAKRAQMHGLHCYSEPRLLKNIDEEPVHHVSSMFDLFRFTKQHYRIRWVFLLFFNLVLFEKKIYFFSFLLAFFYKKRKINPQRLNQIEIQSKSDWVKTGTIDVLIPTIGRKKYLYSVLKNLSSQTHLPKNVIIVEQNPLENSVSELDYLHTEDWPFKIKHYFTHKTGVCNARNIGIEMIESEIVFMADDDIIIDNDLLEKAIENFKKSGAKVFQMACLPKNVELLHEHPKQVSFFGSGHAFLISECLKDLKFNISYEFGFGEDNDFGMQLRKKGYDVLYFSNSKITHLKAPTGGFRTKPELEWSKETIQPKPSPTVMLFCIKYHSIEQQNSYKTLLFVKNFDWKNIFALAKAYKTFDSRWEKSLYWANKLKE